MDDEVVFEDYNIKFAEKDFENIDIETLEKCKVRLEDVLAKLN